jgi:hypothetical protein
MRSIPWLLAAVFSFAPLAVNAAPTEPPPKEGKLPPKQTTKPKPKKPTGDKGMEVEPVDFKTVKDKPQKP